MASAQLLTGSEVWKRISAQLTLARRVHAAIAYFGSGASKLATLKRGQVLVVDMSLRAVKQGATDPREIRRLLRRGVRVFTRSDLHAKLFVIDDMLIVGSANASRNSASILNEAALATRDPIAARRARQFVDAIATEPVRPEYLKRCIREYRPPRFKAAAPQDGADRRKIRQRPKLWVIGGLVPFEPPETERENAEATMERAEELRGDSNTTYVDQVFYSSSSKLIDAIRPGDWAVIGSREDDTIALLPPRQLLTVERYSRGGGKFRWVLNFEAPNDEERLTVSEVRRRAKVPVVVSSTGSPRTRAIHDPVLADSIMRLWTPHGRVSRRRQRRSG